MKIAVAIDSFKGSLTSLEAGNAAKKGILNAMSDAAVQVFPLGDGGEGTMEALTLGMGGRIVTANVTGPLGKSVVCSYGIIDSTKTAVMEMCQAAGITLVEKRCLNPMAATTYGVGEMIADAINAGCRNFIMGIGGSATNDGGVGMLKALGFGFFDKNGREIENGAAGLEHLYKITTNNALKQLDECTFTVACDVTNPLCGKNGCSAVFGPQKGADREMIEKMDCWLDNYAKLTKTVIPDCDELFPGAGAAGGMGFALSSYLKGKLVPGAEMIINATGIEKYISHADIVVTGEGRLDSQSAMGKAPGTLAKLAKKYGKAVIAFSGCVSEDSGSLNENGIDAFFPILRSVVSLDEAMDKNIAANNLSCTAEQVFRAMGAAIALR